MNTYKFTRLWRINYKLVIADNLKEAIEVYKSWLKGKPSLSPQDEEDIVEIKAIGHNQIPEDYDILIKNSSTLTDDFVEEVF